jgi:hypothetical protein
LIYILKRRYIFEDDIAKRLYVQRKPLRPATISPTSDQLRPHPAKFWSPETSRGCSWSIIHTSLSEVIVQFPINRFLATRLKKILSPCIDLYCCFLRWHTYRVILFRSKFGGRIRLKSSSAPYDNPASARPKLPRQKSTSCVVKFAGYS